ncbi:MAG: sigma-54 dependent transcriptional regulator [Bryobacteraceae bacterium]
MQNTKNGKTILVAEDDSEVRSYLEMALSCDGYSVEVAQDGEEALACFQENQGRISAVLLDVMMPRKDGLDTLRELRQIDRDLPVIMISGASSPLNIVEAMKIGATDFLGKPVNNEDLRKAVRRALEKKEAPAPARRDISPVGGNSQAWFGTNPYMMEIHSVLPQIGWSDAPVLIQGETGVGKEVLAREVRRHSPRANKPFLKLNCAALPSELVESELFGYERGAFTGAFQKKPGMFEMANEGTIMLDEIGDMDYKLQAKLLQVLQDHEFQRLGGKETVHVDVRVIAATHCDLEKAIDEERFRADLYYRLNVINLCIPPLRDRTEDIIAITEFLIKKHTPSGTAIPTLPKALKEALMSYNWPGNIRELENLVRKLIILRNPEMLVRDLQSKQQRRAPAPSTVQAAPAKQSPEYTAAPVAEMETANSISILERVTKAKEQAETEAILEVLNATRWNRKEAAARLNIDYKALLYKMKKLSIEDKIASVPTGPFSPASAGVLSYPK